MRLIFAITLFLWSGVLFAQTTELPLIDSAISQAVFKNDDVQKINLLDTSAVLFPRYATRKPFAFITNVPSDLWQITKSPFQRQNRTGLIITLAATGLLIPFDQQITDGVKHFFRQLNVDPNTNYSIPIKIGETKLLKLPKNINSAFYELGEGSISMAIAGGLYLCGKIGKSPRAIHTAADITETFFTMGIATQVLKRISGRQSPFESTASGGKWKPFPSFKEYQVNTSNYDAFPSGHLATMMATVTTLAMNYPENKWIKPIGFGIMSLTGLAMINTDVHWLSDYPLALALGYISAKVTNLRNHPAPKKKVII